MSSPAQPADQQRRAILLDACERATAEKEAALACLPMQSAEWRYLVANTHQARLLIAYLRRRFGL